MLDSTANVVAFATGMVALKAQLNMAQKSHTKLKNEDMDKGQEPSIVSSNENKMVESKEGMPIHDFVSTSSDLEGGKEQDNSS